MTKDRLFTSKKWPLLEIAIIINLSFRVLLYVSLQKCHWGNRLIGLCQICKSIQLFEARGCARGYLHLSHLKLLYISRSHVNKGGGEFALTSLDLGKVPDMSLTGLQCLKIHLLQVMLTTFCGMQAWSLFSFVLSHSDSNLTTTKSYMCGIT